MASYTDQFYNLDPANPPVAGQPISFSTYTLTDANNDNDFDRFNNDSVDGVDIISSWPGDTVTIQLAGGGTLTYTGTTFYLSGGRRVFTPNDGQVLQSGTFVSSTWVNSQGPLLVSQLGPACFTPGTRLRVPGGEVPIETLTPGDLVETLDRGPQPVRWIGSTTVEAVGNRAPVRFAPGVLGNRRPLTVSQQHRMLVTGWQAELMLGEREVLVAARHMVDQPGVSLGAGGEVEYVHLLFDRHEIVFSEGVPSESFHPGSAQLDHDRALLAEITDLFPEILDPAMRDCTAVRRVATGFEARALVA
ncbi:MAG: Hint domain-containing protein [Rhodobacteraceae bacterium]|nr:Hint domain-containing protein [Paracoccaceae bacterium]